MSCNFGCGLATVGVRCSLFESADILRMSGPLQVLMSSSALPSISSTSLNPNQLRAVANERGYPYLVSQPSASDGESPRRWPLILFLHGANVRGTDVSSLADHGLMRLLSGAGELTAAEADVGRDVASRFVVVAPQCAGRIRSAFSSTA